MKKIILSGFGQFGTYPVNSTEQVARELDNRFIGDFFIESVVLPCKIPTETEKNELALFEAAQSFGASGIISLGMSSEKTGLCIESRAHNFIDSKYCPAEINGTAIDTESPEGAELSLDLEPWNIDGFSTRCISKNIPAPELSTDAGRFCCNHLMYTVRSLQIKEPVLSKIPFIFIHVPCSPEAVKGKTDFSAQGKITMATGTVIKGLSQLLRSTSLPTFS